MFAFDGADPFLLATPLRIFRDVRSAGNERCVDVEVFGVRAGRVRLDAVDVLELCVRHGLDALDAADIVIIPSWLGPRVAAPARLLASLRQAHARGAQIVGLCLGVFVLAQAGLLDMQRAAVAGEFADAFAARFPVVRIARNAPYVREANLVTSAGRSAAVDCCLLLARQWFGVRSASRVARHLLVTHAIDWTAAAAGARPRRPWRSPGSEVRVLHLMDWMRAHLGTRQSVPALAARLGLQPRTFARRFEALTGMTPVHWLVQERIAAAQALLACSQVPVEEVATRCGFGSTVGLRVQFKRIVGVSPLAYRKAHAEVTAGDT